MTNANLEALRQSTSNLSAALDRMDKRKGVVTNTKKKTATGLLQTIPQLREAIQREFDAGHIAQARLLEIDLYTCVLESIKAGANNPIALATETLKTQNTFIAKRGVDINQNS